MKQKPQSQRRQSFPVASLGWKLKFALNEFGKRTVRKLERLEYIFCKSRDQVDGLIDPLYLPKIIPNATFNFIPRQEILNSI